MTSSQEIDDGDEILTPQQVQRLLGVGERTYQRYLEDGRLREAFRTSGGAGHRRFRRRDVDAFLAASAEAS